MPVKKLKKFLDSNNVKYLTITHSATYTAQEIAASAHISGKDIAKTVVVKINGKLAMVVLPASQKVDFQLLKGVVSSENIALASEEEFQDLFPDCDIGAMPPFGNLYGMEVLVEESLTKDDEIAFNAGTHTELIKIAYRDFERIVKPKIARFSLRY